MAVRLEWTGIDRMRRVLRSLDGNIPRVVGGALFREGERIMTESKELVPVDFGNLRNSGHVELPEIRGSKVSVTLGYGGPVKVWRGSKRPPEGNIVNYAVVVHEDLEARHKTGSAKYLEGPMLSAAGRMDARLAKSIKRDLERVARVGG